MKERIKQILKELPSSPGSYQMRDKDGKIIYVGKAKILKNRVRSYFLGAKDAKTTALVSKIEDITYIVTKNENEAFLLENNLIKEYHPFYNILLMDDSSYPYIVLTKEEYPRLIVKRNATKKDGLIFGPYANVAGVKELCLLLSNRYKLRKCNTISKNGCIYKDLGECSAPCINGFSDSERAKITKEIKGLLYGSDKSIINELKAEMMAHSEALRFEEALKIKNLLDTLDSLTQSRQDIIIKDQIDADIFGYSFDDKIVSITVSYLRGGNILLKENHLSEYSLDPESVVLNYIMSFYENHSKVDNIFVQDTLVESLSFLTDTNVFSPKIGQKKELLDSAIEDSLNELSKNIGRISLKTRDALDELSKITGADVINRIETFDNSHLFSENPVSSMVVYTAGKKNKKEYRKFKLSSSSAGDDIASMREVLERRYERVLDEDLEVADLIVMDGGKAQVMAAFNTLQSLGLSIPIVGLRKNDKHKTDTLIYMDKEYQLDTHSPLYYFLYELQEEVHRFAIEFHRTSKEKKAFESILDNIPFIGKESIKVLRDKYRKISDIVLASEEELKMIHLNQKQISSLRESLKDYSENE